MADVLKYIRICIAFVGFWTITKAVTTVFIDECKPGKYFWKEKLPTEFYACLTLPKRAVKLRCPPGNYMCNTGPDFFQPCMCKGKWTKYFKHYGMPDKSFQSEKLQHIDGKGPLSDVIPTEIQRMMSTESILDDQARGLPEGKQGPENYGNAIYDGELPEPSLPHSGCPDDFRLVNDAHMYFGVKFEGSLIECQYNCLSKKGCLGVDWSRKKNECYLLSLDERGTVKFGLHYNGQTNHYRRTQCHTTVANNVTPDPKPTKPTPAAKTRPAVTAATTTDASLISRSPAPSSTRDLQVNVPEEPRSAEENNDFNAVYGQYPYGVDFDKAYGKMGTTDGVTPNPGMDPSTGFPISNRNDDSNDIGNDDDDDDDSVNVFESSTTTIPDSGCPFTFEKFEDTSHPFGNNISTGNKFREEEECKHWCIIHSFCRGADFDMNTETCYYHREIDVNIITSIAGVTHYRKTECEPPLKCWSQDTMISSEDDLSVTDPNHAQTTCNGVCFVSQSHNPDSTSIQRGCLTVTDPAMKPENGCGVDQTMQTIVCFCDTPRCNGLSISALTSQMLYLPLDKDLTDHSGHNRDGQALSGLATPQFQCLDKSVNCAALFTGSECVSVSSLATTAWGSQENTNGNTFVPTATFAVWYKRVNNEREAETEGIFGNSIDANNATWQIIGERYTKYVGAGVNTFDSPRLDDYPFIKATVNDWHLVVLTYDGRMNFTAHQFPSLKFYVDCIPTMGNSRRDAGEIGVRDQPVSVGCVKEDFFIGFIDEARIFSTVLSMNDIRALKAMSDTNYFW